MTEQPLKITLKKRLEREGRWRGPGGAEAVRDKLMAEFRKTGLSTEESREKCYPILDAMFPENPVQFVGYVGDVDAIVDQDYHEADAGKRIRDSYIWVCDEFRRITIDMPDGTTQQNFHLAKTPPPTPHAVAIAEYYGENRQRRGELFSRLAQFAERQHQSTPRQTGQQDWQFSDIE